MCIPADTLVIFPLLLNKREKNSHFLYFHFLQNLSMRTIENNEPNQPFEEKTIIKFNRSHLQQLRPKASKYLKYYRKLLYEFLRDGRGFVLSTKSSASVYWKLLLYCESCLFFFYKLKIKTKQKWHNLRRIIVMWHT